MKKRIITVGCAVMTSLFVFILGTTLIPNDRNKEI